MSPAKLQKSRARPAAGKAKPKAGKPAEKGAEKGAGKKPPEPRPRRRRFVRIALIVLAILVLIPAILVPVFTIVPPVGTHMIATRILNGPIERDWVAFDDIAKVAVISVMVSEDGQFCEHGGVDWGALREVIDTPGGPQRGASTIAMQTVRNLFLWLSGGYVRKGLEIPLALYADLVWSKRREMEIYLNIAQWGPNLFGIEAAARHYFDRPASALTARQAALLAVTLPNPLVRNPARPSQGMRTLARRVEARARRAGAYIVCLYP